MNEQGIKYKYNEPEILEDLKAHLDKTYTEHYQTDEPEIECFDAWIALGDSTPTFRNTALKYLWRYGKKSGYNKDDLLKALHYIMMCIYVDFYRIDPFEEVDPGIFKEFPKPIFSYTGLDWGGDKNNEME